MKQLLERLKAALNQLDENDFMIIQEAGVFCYSAIEQITKHLEWMAGRKEEIASNKDEGRTPAECYNKRERSR